MVTVVDRLRPGGSAVVRSPTGTYAFALLHCAEEPAVETAGLPVTAIIMPELVYS